MSGKEKFTVRIVPQVRWQVQTQDEDGKWCSVQSAVNVFSAMDWVKSEYRNFALTILVGDESEQVDGSQMGITWNKIWGGER